jgi:hypothetical protein
VPAGPPDTDRADPTARSAQWRRHDRSQAEPPGDLGLDPAAGVAANRLLGQVRQQDRLAGPHRLAGEPLAGPGRPMGQQRRELGAEPTVTLAHRGQA